MSVTSNQYDTLSQATQDLKERGFSEEFRVNETHRLLDAHDEERTFGPEEVSVLEFHRFEGPSDPADMAVLYGLETPTGTRGILIDAYGANSDENVDEFVKGLRVEHGAESEHRTDNRS